MNAMQIWKFILFKRFSLVFDNSFYPTFSLIIWIIRYKFLPELMFDGNFLP